MGDARMSSGSEFQTVEALNAKTEAKLLTTFTMTIPNSRELNKTLQHIQLSIINKTNKPNVHLGKGCNEKA